MISFVKPSARAKFGLAVAASSALAVSPLMANPAQAATLTVDTCTEFGTGSQVGFADALATANSTAGADVIDMTALSSCTVTFSQKHTISESVTINGGGQVTLYQGGDFNMFDFASGVAIDLVFNDLALEGKTAATKPGLDISATLASTITFNDVTAQNFDRMVVYVRNEHTAITVNNSIFANNLNSGPGGAINSSGDVTINYSTFSGNISSWAFGGAIWVKSGDVVITGSTFTRNSSDRGGAIQVDTEGSSLTITDEAPSYFTYNSTDSSQGGAIYTWDAVVNFEGEKEVTHTFAHNYAKADGGAMTFSGYNIPLTVNIASDLLLHDNRSRRNGGAMVVRNSYEGANSVTFSGDITAHDNSSTNGGVLFIYATDFGYYPTTTRMDLNFTGNVNFYSNTVTGYGGVMSVSTTNAESDFDFTGAQTLINGNAAGNGGAFSLIAYNPDSTPIEGHDNSLSMQGGYVSISDNDAGTLGGAIYSRAFDVEIIGGGEYSIFGDLDASTALTKNQFNANTAGLSGGFIFAKEGSTATFELGRFYDNYARSISVADLKYSQLSLVASEIAGNGGRFSPRVIDVTFGQLNAYANLISDNTASATIAGTYGSETLLVSNTFIGNTSNYGTFVSNGESDFGLVAFHNSFINNVSANSLYSGLLDGTWGHLDPTLTTVRGNLFYSANPSDNQIYITPQYLGPGNLLTGTGGLYNGPQLMPFNPLLGDTYSMLVTAEQLNLTGLQNISNPGNRGVDLQTVGLGEGSVAIDLLKVAPTSLLGSFDFDGRLEGRFLPGTTDPANGTGFDVGAFEVDAEPVDDGDSEPPATEPNVVITGVSKSKINSGGDTFMVYGRGLDGVEKLLVGSVEVSFKVDSSSQLSVTSGQLPVGNFTITAVADNGRAIYQDGVSVVESSSSGGGDGKPKFWTRDLGNGTVKVYAKDIVSAGKVQIFVNGKERAWVRAIDASDPKLRQADGVPYLVRTVELSNSGKTRIEIKLNGKRVRFTTYSN